MRNAEMRKTPFGVGFGYRSWSVETLCNRNAEMKCQNVFSNKAMVTTGGHIVEEL
jgi:hypothetical protein